MIGHTGVLMDTNIEMEINFQIMLPEYSIQTTQMLSK